jgi:hypothetical protein
VSADPTLAVATATVAGIVVGVVIAVAALSSAPLGVGVAATVAWVWMLALASAALSLSAERTPATPRLGLIDAPQVTTRADLWFGPFLMVGIAGVLGLAVAGAGRWLGAHRLGITLSGFAGPALVAAAYLIAGLGAGVTSRRLEPYVASLLAVTVGLLASTAVGGVHRRAAQSTPSTTPSAGPSAVAGGPRRLAIEAAPQPAYAQREPVRAERAAARRVHAIAAKPHSSATPSTATPSTASARAAGKGAKATATSSASSPAASPAKAAVVLDAVPRQAERLLVTPGSEEDKRLRKSERDHIGWMQELVNTPADPDLTRARN